MSKLQQGRRLLTGLRGGLSLAGNKVIDHFALGKFFPLERL
jgi:hypothetical protein